MISNKIKYASRILLVIAAVAKVSCKHELWLVARVNCSVPSLLFLILKFDHLVRLR